MHLHWHEGLFLQAHHLQNLQHQLQMDIRAARGIFAPYGFGLIECRLSHDDLDDGRIRFERLRAIMPSGREVYFPDEANLPALDIKGALVRGAGPIEVFLALPLWTKNRANAFRQGEVADPRVKLLYIPEEVRDVADENTGENAQSIHVRKLNARVALKGEDLSDMESLPVLRIIRSTGEETGKPRLDPEFVPPSLFLRSSPVLHDQMRVLAAQLNASRNDLSVKAATGGHGLEVKWEMALRLLALNRHCASLPSIVEEGIVSPFNIYLQLRELLGELLAVHPEKKIFDCDPYNHLDPYRSFKELDLRIRSLIRVTKGLEPIRVPFTGAPGLLRATLEADHFSKPTGWYLGIKTRVDRTKLALYVTDGNKFKLMPRSMEQVAVLGLELKEENYPPLELPGQNDLHYFRVLRESNQRRLDQLKQDKAASLVWNNTDFDLADASIALYMTLPSDSAS